MIATSNAEAPVMRMWRLCAGLLALILSACGGGDAGEPILAGKLVYVDEAGGQGRLYVSKVDGSDAVETVIGNITVLPPHEAGASNLQASQITSIGPPVWSPDGRSIAVTVSRAENQSQLIVVNAQTGSALTASPQLSLVDDPDWSPDGRYLAYVLAESGLANPRIATTDVSTGAVRELTETAEMNFTAHRWDEASTGLYIGVISPDRRSTDIIHLNLQTAEQTRTGVYGHPSMDLTRSGGEIIRILDFEFGGLLFRESRFADGTSVRTSSALDRGQFSGWFLSSPHLVAVEEIGSSRQPPLIARFDPTSNPNGDRFKEFSVAAPVAFKWDFYAAPDAR